MLRIAMAQVNATVGDLAGMRTRSSDGRGAAPRPGVRLTIFPEMMLTGYPVSIWPCAPRS